MVKGIVERRSGHRSSAKASLQEALGEFTRMGARVWRERAAAELRGIPIRRGSVRESDQARNWIARWKSRVFRRGNPRYHADQQRLSGQTMHEHGQKGSSMSTDRRDQA